MPGSESNILVYAQLSGQPADHHPVEDCLAAFEARAGMSLREFSLHTLSIAGRFRRRSWLQRVHAALFFTKREVLKGRLGESEKTCWAKGNQLKESDQEVFEEDKT